VTEEMMLAQIIKRLEKMECKVDRLVSAVAKIEERGASTARAIEALWTAIESNRNRVSAVENAQPALALASKWVFTAIGAAVALLASKLLKAVGW